MIVFLLKNIAVSSLLFLIFLQSLSAQWVWQNSGTSNHLYDVYFINRHPFNPSTEIRYTIPKDLKVKITIYNSVGEEVAVLLDKFVERGSHSVKFDGTLFASGVYFYKIEAGVYVDTKKKVLMK